MRWPLHNRCNPVSDDLGREEFAHFFLHIAKCGGNTFSAFLSNNFQSSQIYSASESQRDWEKYRLDREEQLKNGTLLEWRKTNNLHEYFARGMRPYDLIAQNHFSLQAANILSEHRKLKRYCLFRDPRERVASHYLHLRRIRKAHRLAPEGETFYHYARSVEIEEFCQALHRGDVWNAIFNRQFRSLLPDASRTYFEQSDVDGLVALALSNLDTFDYVADLSDLQEFCELISEDNSWGHPGPVGCLNRGGHNDQRLAELCERVPYDIVELDDMLLTAVRRRYLEQREEKRTRVASDEKQLIGMGNILRNHGEWNANLLARFGCRNFYTVERDGPNVHCWLGPDLVSSIVVPMVAGEDHKIDIYLKAFVTPKILEGTKFQLDSRCLTAVYGIGEQCTVVHLHIPAKDVTSASGELRICAPFVSSEVAEQWGEDVRLKSMALAKVVVKVAPRSHYRPVGKHVNEGLGIGVRPLIFTHIPKCGGTSIGAALRPAYSDQNTMPQLDQNFHAGHPIWRVMAKNFALFGVGMHLDHANASAIVAHCRDLGSSPVLMTVIREPLARLHSQYKEWRGTKPELFARAAPLAREAIQLAKMSSFQQFLLSDNPVIVNSCDNLQTRMLVGLANALSMTEEEIFQRAKKNLSQYDIIGATDNLTTIIEELNATLDYLPGELGGTAYHLHRSEPLDMELLRVDSEEAIARLTAYTRLDCRLQNFVQEQQLEKPRPAPTFQENESPIAILQAGKPSASVIREKSGSWVRLTPFSELQKRVGRLISEMPDDALGRPGARTIKALWTALRPKSVTGYGKYQWSDVKGDEEQVQTSGIELLVYRAYVLKNQAPRLLQTLTDCNQLVVAVTELDSSDFRIHLVAQLPDLREYMFAVGADLDLVWIINLSEMYADMGGIFCEALLNLIIRFHDTSCAALARLQDSHPNRLLLRSLLSQIEQAQDSLEQWRGKKNGGMFSLLHQFFPEYRQSPVEQEQYWSGNDETFKVLMSTYERRLQGFLQN